MNDIEKKQTDALQRSVDRVEDQVEAIAKETEGVPQPADSDVLARLESLAADKDILVERFDRLNSGETTVCAGPELSELSALASRLDTEGRALLHESEFLSMGARTTLDIILEGTTRVADALRDRISKDGD